MGQEQMNTPNSTNTVDMNFFKSLAYLLSNSYKNHPIKFWTNVGLLILSIGTLVIIRTDSGFIHSLLSNKTNQLINSYLDFVSALYIVGLIFYLYWKVSPIKKDLMLSGVIIFLILISITVALLLIPVYNGLRYFILPQMELALEEFGSFFASITGLLAFLAVLYTSNVADKRAKETIALAKGEAENNRVRAEKAEENNKLRFEEARNRYREDSERTIFFQLLDLHTKIVNTLFFNRIYNNESKRDNVGVMALKFYVEELNDYIPLYLIQKDISSAETENDLINKGSEQVNKQIQIALNIIKRSRNYNDFSKMSRAYNDFLGQNNIVDREIYIKSHYDIGMWAFFIKMDMALSSKLECIQYVSNVIYKESGHILGQYLKITYYILETIDNFRSDISMKQYYIGLLKSELSRYELPLILMYAVNPCKDKNFAKLLRKYNILEEFYYKDFYFTASDTNSIKDEKTKQEEGVLFVNQIIDEYLRI